MDRFERDGLVFEVRDAGPPDGDVVVLLHGFPQGLGTFDEVVPPLHDAGLRTLVPLQRGYSPGARPRHRRDYRTAETAADVVALLDAAGVERAHLVGHDWGGATAWGVAGLHADRVATLTSLSTPHPAALRKAFVTTTQGLKSSYMLLFQLPWLPEVLARRTLPGTLRSSGLPERFVESYVAAMAAPGALTGALDWYRGLPFSTSPPVRASRVPTTYVWGRKDFALGRPAGEATKHYVEAPYAFVELNAGHWLPETRPAEVAAAVLDRVRSV